MNCVVVKDEKISFLLSLFVAVVFIFAMLVIDNRRFRSEEKDYNEKHDFWFKVVEKLMKEFEKKLEKKP